MMLLLIDAAVKNGNDGIDLTTLPTNDRAYNLYCSVGFRQIGFVENPLAAAGVTVERALRYIRSGGSVGRSSGPSRRRRRGSTALRHAHER
jgi:ribosomal protein S18 acetylase RimI-like enzyme